MKTDRKSLIILSIAAFLILAGAVYAGVYNPNCYGAHIGTAFDCYRAPGSSATPPSPLVRVTEWNDDKCLTNNNAPDIFVPTNTSAEWGAFKNAVPNIQVTMTNPVNGACPGGGGGGDPSYSAEGDTGIYLPAQYCSPNQWTSMAAAIGRVRANDGPNNPPLWRGVRTSIANATGWSATTKANANLVVDELVPAFTPSPPYQIIPNQYWGGDKSGTITKNGQTFDWTTSVYEGAPTDACTTGSNRYQAEAHIDIVGPTN